MGDHGMNHLSCMQRCSLETLVLVSRHFEDMKNGLGLGLCLEIKVLVLILVLRKKSGLGLDEKVSIFSMIIQTAL